MAGFYLDEDVSESVSRELVRRGIDVRHARREPGMQGATDPTQLLVAVRDGRCMVTHNRKDFFLLHDAWRRWTGDFGLTLPHAGIVLLPQRVDAIAVADALALLVDKDTIFTNELYAWHPVEGWRHHPYRP